MCRRKRLGASPPCLVVRCLGDRKRRRGRWDPSVRSVSISVLDDDGFPRGDLPRAVCAASQNWLTRQADKRSHLDLQIDLLAEREMTAVLQLLQDIARHLAVQTSVTPEQLRDLMKKTDLGRLTTRLDELAEPATPAMVAGSGGIGQA